MADLNALIAQGAQFNLPNPVDQYSKVMQLQAAQQQMQVQRQQMQQIQEDRAGFAKLRETLAQQNLTPEQYETALTQSPDPSHQKMGVEMRFRRSRLAELEKAMGNAEPVSAPSAMLAPTEMPAAKTFDTSAAMVAPVQKPYSEMSNREKILYNEWTGRGRLPQTALVPNALAAQVAPAAPMANAMVAQAPVANATSTKQAQLADISKKLAVLTKPQFSDVAGVKDQIAYLRDEQKRLSESPLAKIDPKDYDPDSFAAYMQTGDATKLRKITDQRLAFDQTKFEWEKANPGKEIKEVTQGGVAKYFAIDKRTGESTPVTVAGGKVLTGTDMASQRLAFDQTKFSWEKANPGFTIQQTEDGSIVGVNNRTLQAYPVTLNAGTPPSPAPFTGVGGAAPVAGAGRGAVGVTDGRMAPSAPVAAPAGMPLKGKGLQPTEGERKFATLLQRLQFSQSQLTDALVDDPNAAKPGLFASAVAKLSTPLANTLTSEARQRVQAAQLDMLDAALTLGTGAAYTKEQLEGYRESYFPQIGDKPNQILDKQKRLENVISAAKIAAGRAAQLVPTAPARALAPPSSANSAMSAADEILKNTVRR